MINRPESALLYATGKVQDSHLSVSHLEEQASRRGFEFVDLAPWFASDWPAHHARFEFATDYHWNEHGHSVTAQALRDIVAQRWKSLP